MISAETAHKFAQESRVSEEEHWLHRANHLIEEEAKYGGPNSGTAVANWIAENHPKVGQFVCHSWNITRRKYMEDKIRETGYQVVGIQFGKELLSKV